jgi:hypothetical protein
MAFAALARWLDGLGITTADSSAPAPGRASDGPTGQTAFCTMAFPKVHGKPLNVMVRQLAAHCIATAVPGNTLNEVAAHKLGYMPPAADPMASPACTPAHSLPQIDVG